MSELTKQQREWERLGDNAPRWRDILKLCNEVEELEKEIAEMEIELRHARCAQDHAVMYANGDRACAACGWIYK